MNDPLPARTSGLALRLRGRSSVLKRLSALILLASISVQAERIPWTANKVVGSPHPPAPYTIERRFPELTFEKPVDLASLPGTDRLMILEQGGKLFSFPAEPGANKADLAFDFRTHHQPFDSAFAFAFHPRFLENRHIFVCYVEPGGRPEGSYISCFTLRASDPPTIDPGSERVILQWLSGGHNGCTLAFGNDGFLYISTGDAASPDPPDMPRKTGQDISDLLASILRIDVDRTEPAKNYAIPADNPFVKTPDARPEVYAFGFRNPWRMSFDRTTGALWVGDVGWEQWEMIYRVVKGGNYGWSLTEGPNTQVRSDVQPGPGPILPALVALPHSDAASITGGLVYYGTQLPKLTGAYLYGDWETGKFWALRNDGEQLISNDELCDTTLRPVSFATDHEGEFLILDYNGGIYRFITNTAPAANLAFPRRLSETGLFGELATLTPAPGVVPYTPNAIMWSDGAQAEHLLGIPGQEAIVTADGRETITGRMWYYPSNTVFARTLTLEMERGNPVTRRRIETQLMHFDGQTWNPYTYRWNGTQTDAALVPPEGTNDVLTVTDPQAPGGKRELHWRFAGRAECLRCHTVWGSDTLSFTWPQLNADGAASEMRRLEKLELLRVKNPPREPVSLVNPHDSSAPLEARARSWLHANCASCHRFGAGGGVPSQLNYDQPLANSRTLDALPVRGDFGIPAARVIAPGEPFRSTLYYRISTEGPGHMPQIGSRTIDEAGLALVRDWIRSLSPARTTDPEVVVARKAQAEHQALLRQLDNESTEPIAKLLANTSGALALLDYISLPAPDGQLKPSSAEREKLISTVLAVAEKSENPVIHGLFEHLLPPEQRRRVLGLDFDPRIVLNLKGDFERGRGLFHGLSQCATCHVLDGAGRAFGPDLTQASSKYARRELFEHIINPNKLVPPEYALVSLTLKDDTELSGFVTGRTETELMIRDASAAEHRIPFSNIAEKRESTLSAMPEGLLAALTAQEAADLLEYLGGGGKRRIR